MKTINPNALYVIYDGECYFCNHTAKALKIKKAVEELVLINAREPHELVNRALQQGLDINSGIVVYYQQQFFHAQDAINLLNSLADQSTCRQKFTHKLCKNKMAMVLGYPILKSLRNFTLKLQGKTKIHHPDFNPIFQSVFAKDWDNLPVVIKKHYANRPYSNDITRAEGRMTISFAPVMKRIIPLLSFFRLFPSPGNDIPVQVNYLSSPKDDRFIFDRQFYYPDCAKPFSFKSTLWKIKDNLIVDVLGFGLGLKFKYEYDGKKIRFIHSGYLLVLGKLRIALPLSFLIGKGYGEETPLSETSFHFFLESVHPLWGRLIRYEGVFSLLSAKENSENAGRGNQAF